MDETARKKSLARAWVDAAKLHGVEVDYAARMAAFDWMLDKPIRPVAGPIEPAADETAHRARERFCEDVLEAERAHGVKIPEEVKARLLMWLLSGVKS